MHRRTRPYRPQTNGKAERFNRILADEFLDAKRFRSESERRIRLRRWICDYNCHRHHTAVGGPPVSRSNNLTRTDIEAKGHRIRAQPSATATKQNTNEPDVPPG